MSRIEIIENWHWAHFKNLVKEETAIKFRFALKEEWRGPKAHDCILSCLLAG